MQVLRPLPGLLTSEGKCSNMVCPNKPQGPGMHAKFICSCQLLLYIIVHSILAEKQTAKSVRVSLIIPEHLLFPKIAHSIWYPYIWGRERVPGEKGLDNLAKWNFLALNFTLLILTPSRQGREYLKN